MNYSDNLSYKEYGIGDDVIVLIHGYLSSSRYWNKIRPSLVTAGYRVITIDLLGFGNAAKPRNIEYDYKDQTEYVNRIIDHLQLKHVIIIGHSMGALVVARYAVLFPSKLQALILLHPPLYADPAQAKETLARTGLYRHLLGSKYRNTTWVIIRILVPNLIARHAHYAREKSLQNIIVKAELFADLNKLKTRSLVFVGLKDRPIYQRNLAKVSVQPLVKVVFENVGHHSPIRRPALVRRLVLDFIKS